MWVLAPSDRDEHRAAERGLVSNLQLGAEVKPLLVEIAQQLGAAVADLRDADHPSRLDVRQPLVVVDGDGSLLGGNRLAVGTHGRIPHGAVDVLLEVLGDGVFETLRLGVDTVPPVPEGLREVELEQPVVADDFESHLFPSPGQPHPLVGSVPEQAHLRQFLDHVGRRSRRDLHALGEQGSGDRSVAGFFRIRAVGKLVYRLQVVLDRLADRPGGWEPVAAAVALRGQRRVTCISTESRAIEADF